MTDKSEKDADFERVQRILDSRFDVFDTLDELIASINGPMAEREALVQAYMAKGLSRDDATIRAILERRPNA